MNKNISEEEIRKVLEELDIFFASDKQKHEIHVENFEIEIYGSAQHSNVRITQRE